MPRHNFLYLVKIIINKENLLSLYFNILHENYNNEMLNLIFKNLVKLNNFKLFSTYIQFMITK